MNCTSNDQFQQMETACGALFSELQVIWDEIGEPDSVRDRMLLELEKECLEIYRRKVDQANKCRAQLRQTIAEYETELAAICAAIGENPVHIKQSTQNLKGLREELNVIVPQLDEMRKKKKERWSQFLEVIDQIKQISSEIAPSDPSPAKLALDESDLSLRKLEELHMDLQSLQIEKRERLNRVLQLSSKLNSLCEVLGIDFKQTVFEVHPSLGDAEGLKNISNETIARLLSEIERLQQTKVQRMQKLQDLVTTMVELWNLMDTPSEEQVIFRSAISCVTASENELTEPNTLSSDFIRYVEDEVARLKEVKVSKMKDLVFKKKAELEEHKRRAHLVDETEVEFSFEAIEAGAVDASLVLEQIELRISAVKEEAFSRKDILERVDKWLAACEEESWLEEYNNDENRYNAGRGSHLNLKRAEKARILVNKIPAMVDNLAGRIIAWEKDHTTLFTYDGIRLLTMLEEYTLLRQEKEQQRKRQRDQKKLQDQLITEQEALYGSQPSPSKTMSAKKQPRNSTGGGASSRRLSLGGATIAHTQNKTYRRPTKAIDDTSLISSGSRGFELSRLPAKKLPMLEAEPPRQPFTAITALCNIPSTPVRMSNEPQPEFKTPKPVAPAPPAVPETPGTVSAPMHMAMTPAPPATPVEITEYSFEERRLAFYLAR